MWHNIETLTPEIGQRVEYYFAPAPDFVIQETGTFEGFYRDDSGKLYPAMHMFVSDDKQHWLTGDVTHWRKL